MASDSDGQPVAGGYGVEGDLLETFQLDRSGLRGRIVRLGPAIDQVLAPHDYPVAIATLLGEALALTALLAGMLKYDGIFTLQVKGDGPVRMLVADMSSDGALRGYAQFDTDQLAAVMQLAAPVQVGLPQRPEGRRVAAVMRQEVPQLLGRGYLAFTVDQGVHTQRYQGIVALTGDTLVDCVDHYFTQSEQLLARLKLAVGRIEGGGHAGWRAGGVLLQQMPATGEAGAAEAALARNRDPELRGAGEPGAEEHWRRAVALLDTATDHELLDPAIGADTLLFRLFHEEEVRAFTPQTLRFACRCSPQRVETALRAIPAAELQEVAEAGRVEVTCEFCATRYGFDIASIQ